MTEQEALDRLARAGVATLATIAPSGRPHLVPFVFSLEGATLVSAVDQKPKRSRSLARLDNIAADPRVTVLAHHYRTDWSKLWWVRIDGRAEVTNDPPVMLRESLVARHPQYAAHPPIGPWIVISIEQVSGWAASP